MKHFKFFVFISILTFAVSCGQQKKYIEYKVKEGETMRVIAKKLDMKTKDLLRLNPDISRRPEVNTVIIVPNKKMIEGVKKDTVTIKNKDIKNDVITDNEKEEIKTEAEIEKLKKLKELRKIYILHEVVKGDTFFNLTRKYNVTKEMMVDLNPELKEGLKLGQFLKIKERDEPYIDDTFLYNDFIEEGVSIKAAILLPFKATEFDSLSPKDIYGKSRLANIVTDFYLGAEIAIDSIRKQGVELDISVFDTGKNSTKILDIINNTNLDDNDAIIGPLYSEEVTLLAKKIKTPIVYPVYSKEQSQFSSKRIVKTSPNKQLFRNKLLEYIEENFYEGNIIIVGDGKADSNFNAKEIERILESHDSISSVNVIIPKDGYIEKSKFTEVLKPAINNLVILTTDDTILVDSTVNSLISLPEDTTVQLYTFDRGSAFNKIDNRKLAQLNFTYVSDEFVNENKEEVRIFNRKYFRKNGALPSFYATKGFDITYDILIRLASGKRLKSTFDEGYSYRVESKFDYTDKVFKITENKGLFIIRYNKDLSLTRLK